MITFATFRTTYFRYNSVHNACTCMQQLLDELPMMVASYCSLFCALEIRNKTPRRGLTIGLFLGMMFQGLSYAVFQWFFIFIVGYSAVMTIQMCIILINVSKDFQSKKWQSQTFWLALIGLILILSSCSLWILENAFCDSLGKFKLHAVWHLFGGYGLFLFDLLLIMLRGEHLKKEANVKFSKDVAVHFVEWIDV
eukprot:652744_1